MNEVLTQQEIDALLASVESGELDVNVAEEKEQVKVRSHDFKRPARLSKEYMTTLTMIFEEYAKIAGNLLATQVRTTAEMRLAAIEQVSFEEFLHAIPSFTLMGIFQSHPQAGMQIVEINSRLCSQLVELLCGSSDAKLAAQENAKANFTDIEMAILEEVVQNFGQSFQTAFHDIVALEVKMETMETNAQWLQTMSPNEPVIMSTFIIELLGQQTHVNLCVPYVFFEGILEKLSFRNWFDSGKTTNPSEQESLNKSLQSVPVSIEVLLGETEITMENFLQLELGDIIPLDKHISEPLVMSIEKSPYYLVKPGVVGNKMAVEVLQYIGGEAEE